MMHADLTAHDRAESARLIERHRRATAGFGDLVHAVRSDEWGLPTPCAEWTVRELVNHVTAENLWMPPLLSGATTDDVGDRFDGDVLGDDPLRAWDVAVAEALAALDAPGALSRAVHLSFGSTSADEYVRQLLADHLVHAWDLSQALDADGRLDDELVTACADWFDAVEETYRRAGVVGRREPVAVDADAQTRLLARFGRSATRFLVERFTHAFNAHDVDAVMRLMTDDCVFDSTGPAPDGRRYRGRDEVRACWQKLFDTTPSAHFALEDVVATDERAVARWTYDWGAGHVRGVDVYTIGDGKVAAKYSYVKG
ncbi:MAG TPA: TIGR03086 family metal-binding protein [Euzebyales bacterium]